MRKHISKAITRRSSTIRAVLEKYNRLAPLQSPRRPVLDYSEIVSYASLGDFALLKHSSHEIVEKPWAIPLHRQMAINHFKVLRAHEEIARLNVEARRLDAWLAHEDRHLASVASELRDAEPLLSAEIHSLSTVRRSIHDLHRSRLRELYRLKGYSGPGPYSPSGPIEGDDESTDDPWLAPDDDDAVCDEVLRLGDCLENML
jgi:hypothetical protein